MMKTLNKKVLSVLLCLCMVSAFTLSACGIEEQIARLVQGENIGEVGKEYSTKWFTFTVDSMSTTQSIPEYSANEGNLLLVATITQTNTSGARQPFGTFDWFVDDTSLPDYLYPEELNSVNSTMMPDEFWLSDGESATYTVVIEFPENLASPFLVYIEVDENEQTYATFKIPISS